MSDSPKHPETVVVNIDGEDIEVPVGVTMIEAAEMAGKEIPHYCYHPKLSVSGNCRMCLVEMGMPMRDRETGEAMLDENGKPKVGWMPKPAIACNSKVSPGLHIKTDTPLVRDCRNGVMEFLLVNHPLDCPICDQAGECRLQEFATEYGRGYSRFVEQKNVKPKRTVLGPRVMLDDERCILCSRCIRFMDEIPGESVLGFIDRGSYSTLTCYPGRQLDSNYSLNTVDICPVGALTSRDFRFKMRVWFLQPVESVCTESSAGANTEVWQREGKIYRITPRRNDAVNDTWMTDSGRALHEAVEAKDRPRSYRVEGRDETPGEAIEETVRLLSAGKVGLVASAQSSLEEQFLLKELGSAANASTWMVSHTGESDGLLVSADRTPNLRGALVTGLIDELPPGDLSGLGRAIDAGEVDTLLVVREDPVAAGLSSGQLAKVRWIYLGNEGFESLSQARVVLPALTVFEKAGSFINQQFRLQRFLQVIPGPAGVLSDSALLASLLLRLRDESVTLPEIDEVWSLLASVHPVLEGLSFSAIPSDGVALDPRPWIDLPFPETKGLKFDPEGFKKEARSWRESRPLATST